MAAEPSAAQRAVEAAKKYAGTTLTVHWRAGLQALDPKNYTGPLWEQLTGIKIRVIETSLAEVFTKTLQEYRAGTGSFDVLDVVPSWMPDLARAGALEPLDSFIQRFGYREEIDSIAPAFRDNQTKVGGRIFGIPDDGDVFILYFRKDLFSDQHLKAEFQKRLGYALAPPATWQQFSDTASFFTKQLKKDGIYGATLADDPSLAQYMFQMRFRGEGGKFFDPKTMKATVNSPAGVKTFNDMRNENHFMPPGVEKFTFADSLAVFLNGNAAMTVGWPPIGRWAAGYGTEEKALGFVPKSKIAGKVGYALPPGKNPQLAIGHCLSVSANSKHKKPPICSFNG
ncbi:MAG: extracellular solute-binding protein [Burkholderiales bacterium]